MHAKDEVEGEIIQDNSIRFKLAYALPLLEEELCNQLGISSKEAIAEEFLIRRANLEKWLAM